MKEHHRALPWAVTLSLSKGAAGAIKGKPHAAYFDKLSMTKVAASLPSALADG
jgi:hypothetical protein